MQVHENRIEEAEQRISTIEEEIMEVHSFTTKSDTAIQILLEKVDDLENRSRRNNLRIVGIPETVKPIDDYVRKPSHMPQA